MPARSCLVSVTDFRGIRHSAEVEADSLFEAAILGLHAFQASGWIEDLGPATRVEIAVRGPVVRHTVTVNQLQRWAAGAAGSPAERLKRDRLKAMLASSGRR